MFDLKALRRSVGFTQIRLARLAGVSAWRVAQFESGVLELTDAEVERLKLALGQAARENAARLEAALGQPVGA